MQLLYRNSTDDVDLFVGGLLETKSDELPGETFRAILLDQFVRIRDGDRFWFENAKNKLFDESETEEIRNITMRDILIKAAGLDPNLISLNAFLYDSENRTSCHQPYQINSSVLVPCGQTGGYDFFEGSEVSFILTFLFLALVPLGTIFSLVRPIYI